MKCIFYITSMMEKSLPIIRHTYLVWYLIRWQFDLQFFCFCRLCGITSPFNPCAALSCRAFLTFPPSNPTWHRCSPSLCDTFGRPAGSYPSCDAVAQLPCHIKDPTLFAPAVLPLCQILCAKLIEKSLSLTHMASIPLAVCWYEFTQTSFMSIHTYVTEHNCWQGLLVMFTLRYDWWDKMWQWRGRAWK